MREILEYKALWYSSGGVTKWHEFTGMINRHIDQGWRPWGTPTASSSSVENIFIQAMVKYGEAKEKKKKVYTPDI